MLSLVTEGAVNVAWPFASVVADPIPVIVTVASSTGVEVPSVNHISNGAEKFTVRFKAKELTWIEIKIDEKAPFDITLRKGDTYRINSSGKVYVKIGNAGGVLVFFNDKELGQIGLSGEVVNLVFPDIVDNLE